MINKYLLLLIVVSLFFPSSVAAQVVINEVFPNPSGDSKELGEFVEVYNFGSDEVDLTNYTLCDNVKSFVIHETTILGGGEYFSLSKEVTGLALNNSDGDTLTLKNDEDEIVDTFSYNLTIEDKSWSRIPDGDGHFENNTEPTQNSPNLPPPAPTPTQTSTPTPFPTPTPTQKPTNTPTSAPTPTVKPTQNEISKDETDGTAFFHNGNKDNTLGSQDDVEDLSDENENSDVVNSEGNKFPIASIAFIIGGLSFVGAGIYPVVKKQFESKKKKYGKLEKEKSDRI